MVAVWILVSDAASLGDARIRVQWHSVLHFVLVVLASNQENALVEAADDRYFGRGLLLHLAATLRLLAVLLLLATRWLLLLALRCVLRGWLSLGLLPVFPLQLAARL